MEAIALQLLYYIQDPEELSAREGSAYSLRRFVDCFAGKSSSEQAQPLIALWSPLFFPRFVRVFWLSTNLSDTGILMSLGTWLPMVLGTLFWMI